MQEVGIAGKRERKRSLSGQDLLERSIGAQMALVLSSKDEYGKLERAKLVGPLIKLRGTYCIDRGNGVFFKLESSWLPRVQEIEKPEPDYFEGAKLILSLNVAPISEAKVPLKKTGLVWPQARKKRRPAGKRTSRESTAQGKTKADR